MDMESRDVDDVCQTLINVKVLTCRRPLAPTCIKVNIWSFCRFLNLVFDFYCDVLD